MRIGIVLLLPVVSMIGGLAGCGGASDDPGGDPCTDTCTAAGEARCTDGAVQLCVSVDGCLLWSEAVACPTGAACTDGRCVVEEACESDCEEAGLARCVEGGVQICLDLDGCLLWSAPVACADDEVCTEGRCVGEKPCEDECAARGVTRCAAAQEAVETCVSVGGCLRWTDPAACEAGATCLDGRCQGCTGESGTYHAQSIEVDGETRFYYLHVPDAYRCEDAWPLLIHLHGTVTNYDRPEEAYGLGEMVALADEEGLIVARPRSRSGAWSGGEVYQWDINQGDLDRNAAYVRALVDEIGRRYHLDPDRVYASGFSNGTNMAMKLLEALPDRFSGYGMVGGGFWWPLDFPSLDQDPPRIFAVTGYRDYMYESLRDLFGALSAAGLPDGHLRQRRVDAGHEIYGWHMREMWAWLDRGETPAPGELQQPWLADDTFPSDASLLEVEVTSDGALVVAGEAGVLWRRGPGDEPWTRATGLPAGYVHNLSGLCMFASGRGLAVGEGTLARTEDGGLSWSELPRLPDHQESGFGFAYLVGIGCSPEQEAFAGGYWAGAASADGGDTWEGGVIPTPYGMAAQIVDVAWGDEGVAVAVGYPNYLGRSTDGVHFEPITSPRYDAWYNAVASAPGGRFWAVGAAGVILASTDGGASWTDQSVDGAGDLYAVAFRDALAGLAVGSHGTALLTEDGGQSWQDLNVGLDIYLGDIAWIDDTTAVVVGEHGTVLTLQP